MATKAVASSPELALVLEQLPENSGVRSALVHALVSEPDRFQREVLTLASADLGASLRASEAAKAEAQERLQACREFIKESEAALERVQASVASAASKASVASTAQAASAEKLRCLEKAHEEIVAETAFDIDLHVQEQRLLLEVQQLIVKMQSAKASAELAERSCAADEVVAYLQAQHAEKALIAAVPAAFRLAPSERDSFDDLVVKEAERVVAAAESKAEARLAEVAEAGRFAEAERVGHWAIVDIAREALAAAQIAAASAEADLAVVEEERDEAKEELRRRRDMEELQREKEASAEANRVKAIEAASALEKLIALAQSPPAPAEAEPDEDVVMEGDAEAEAEAEGDVPMAAAEGDVPMAAAEGEAPLQEPHGELGVAEEPQQQEQLQQRELKVAEELPAEGHLAQFVPAAGA